jgi:hypothetical protein
VFELTPTKSLFNVSIQLQLQSTKESQSLFLTLPYGNIFNNGPQVSILVQQPPREHGLLFSIVAPAS